MVYRQRIWPVGKDLVRSENIIREDIDWRLESGEKSSQRA